MKTVAKSLLASTAILLSATGCRNDSSQEASKTKVVDIADSQIKWQSIGNCWVYASIGWVESLLLRSGQEESNFSETYLTYRHYQDQLTNRNIDKLQTGGFWGNGYRRGAMELIKDYGLMREGDFIEGEANATFSNVQKSATNAVNKKLADDEFRTKLFAASGQEREDMVIALLDEAFGVNIKSLEANAITAQSIQFNDEDGVATDLLAEINKWNLVNHKSWWSDWRSLSGLTLDALPAVSEFDLTPTQLNHQKRVMSALNAGEPVVLEWFVDFNALNDEGIFSLETLKEKGPGTQGYHQTVIEDYVVEVLEDGVWQELPEGDVSQEDKDRAVREGRLKYLIVKNSWGGDDRFDQASYVVAGKKGYHRLNVDYLYGWMGRKGSDDEVTSGETGLRGWIFPTSEY